MSATFLITGSTSGIGKTVTEKLLAEGSRVVGLARDHSKVSEFGDKYVPISVDFSKERELDAQFKKIVKSYPEIEGLVLCAGYGQFAELEQFSFEQMRSIMQVNFLSQALLVKSFLPLLKKRNNSQIVAIGSECALEGYKKASLYCASKFALRGFLQSVRKESRGAGLAVTLVNPGLVRTSFFNDLKFEPGDLEENSISVDRLAEMILLALKTKGTCVFEEINCQPLKSMIRAKN